MDTINTKDTNSHPATSALFTSGEPLTHYKNFHHSKTYIANSGINPLLTSASALINTMAKLSQMSDYEDLSQLHDNLVYEICAFECNAQAQHYSTHTILAARLALCASLDETISTMTTKAWSPFLLTQYFYRSNDFSSSFLSMIDNALTNQMASTDLLEFFYVCLNIAFVGRFRHSPIEYQQIHSLAEQLYQSIKKQSKQALIYSQANTKQPRQEQKNKTAYPLRSIGIGTIVLLISLYLGYNFILKTSTKPIYTKLEQLSHETNDADF